MKEKEFNLLEEPWIKVVTNNAAHKEVSLTDLLTHAHEYNQLSGESPAQDAAILRLLLAIVETIFYRYEIDGSEELLSEENSDPEDVLDRWTAYYENGAFPDSLVRSYLEQYMDRFWLFHPKAPFYQVSDLAYGTDYKAFCLLGNIKESNNKATRHHFSMSEGISLNEILYPEAARWLVFFNSYAVNVKSDKKAPGTKNPVGTGRMGRIGFLYVNRRNLFETLLYNLCPLRDGLDLWGAPYPTWEEPVCSLQAREVPVPDNLPQAYTLQSRRICLERKEPGVVCGFRVMGGDYYSMENETSEQMTLWRVHIDKKTKRKTEVPKTHNPDIQVWREFQTIICEDREDKDSGRLPGLIKWIERLILEGCIDNSEYLTLRTTGIVYGDGMNYTFGDCVDDEMSFSAYIMNGSGEEWKTLIKDEIVSCRKVEEKIKKFTDGVCSLLFGKDSNKKGVVGKKLIRTYYSNIDSSFRQWLLSIDNDSEDRLRKQSEWEKIGYRTARKTVEDYVLSLGSASYNRIVTDRKGGKSIPELLNQYLREMSCIYQNVAVSQSKKGVI